MLGDRHQLSPKIDALETRQARHGVLEVLACRLIEVSLVRLAAWRPHTDCTLHRSRLMARLRPRQLSSTARGYGHRWRKLRLTILNRDGWVCHYCGNPANSVDHIVPKSQGGTDDPRNLVRRVHRR